MEDVLPPTQSRTHKGKGVGLCPHLKSCHCLWHYIVKSVSEQRFPLTAACALRLGRCDQTGLPSCPSHGAAAVPRASMQGIFCLPVRPTSLTWTHHTMCGATCCWPLLASIHPSRLMSHPAPSTSADGHCSPLAELVSRTPLTIVGSQEMSAVVWLLRGGTDALICSGSEPE
jgi:hypothetical protein